ncbi:hypothetical protein BGX26_012655 [Mortierella sp. AD094]|nr:hypothetical protein BGX26_012655 [Mortierella sp. AD094]
METEPIIRKSSRLVEKAAAKALKKASEPPAPAASPTRTSKRQRVESTEETSAETNVKKTKTAKVTKTTKTTKTTTPTKTAKATKTTKTSKTAKATKTTKTTKTAKTTKTTTSTKTAKATKTTKTTKTTKAAAEPTKSKRKASEATSATETKRSRKSKEIDLEELVGDAAVKGKKQPTKKRKADDDISAEPEVKPKKTRAPSKKKTSLDVIPAPRLVNRSDPCSLFPTEVWQHILGFLPLSQVAKISAVSKTWLDGSRSFPAWKVICDAHKALGKPKIKYRTYMALACSKSCWVCDKCHSISTGRGNASEIPLPVADEDDNDAIWNLCHSCRRDYYRRHPEPQREDLNRDWRGSKITKTDACDMYHLSDNDLDGLYYDECRNPYYRGAYPMKLFDREEVQDLALRVHAGWVGISAANGGLYKKRSLKCKARDGEFAVRKYTSRKTKGALLAGVSKAATATQSTESHSQTQTQAQSQSEELKQD